MEECVLRLGLTDSLLEGFALILTMLQNNRFYFLLGGRANHV